MPVWVRQPDSDEELRMSPQVREFYGQIDDINRIRKSLAENGIDSQVLKIK